MPEPARHLGVQDQGDDMRIENIVGILTLLVGFLALWIIRDPAMANHKIETIVAASRILRS